MSAHVSYEINAQQNIKCMTVLNACFYDSDNKYLYKVMLYHMTNLKTIVYSYTLSILPLFAQKIFRPLPLSLIPAAFYLLLLVLTNLVMGCTADVLTHPR